MIELRVLDTIAFKWYLRKNINKMKSPYFTSTKIKTGFINRIPYWINPYGEVILTTPLDHALYAIKYYKEQGMTLEPEYAIEKMINEGWIRVQVFPDGEAIIQGIPSALKKNGEIILNIVPDLKVVGIAYVPWDYKKPPIFTREEINKLNWSELIDYAMRIGKFAKRTSVKRRRIWGV